MELTAGYQVTVTRCGPEGSTPKWIIGSPRPVTGGSLGIAYQGRDEITSITITSHTAEYALDVAHDLVRIERDQRAAAMRTAIAAYEKELGL